MAITDDAIISLLSSSYLHKPAHLHTHVIPQFRHRLELVSRFKIPPGSRVLELGCGQGETTLVLAQIVGPTGQVVGVDPARLDYGQPITVSAARSHILNSPLGSRISFHALNPLTYLTTLPPGEHFDLIILSHSLWYFPSHASVLETLSALRPYAPRLCIAEYSFSYSLPEQIPHVLAAKCQALFYSYKTPEQRDATEPNVRSAPSPEQIRVLAKQAGWGLRSSEEGVEIQGMVTPADDVADGRWEVKWVCCFSQFTDEIESVLSRADQVKAKEEVLDLREQTKKALEKVNKGELEEGDVNRCKTMDVWWADFERV